MNVDNSSAAGTATAATTKKAQMVGYDAFLKLLIAQMKNQDPTNPTDSTQYLSQLASFSAVEQAVQTNAKLDALLNGPGLAQAEALIGRTVTSADGNTTGRVTAVTIAESGLIAILASGEEVPLTTGITLS